MPVRLLAVVGIVGPIYYVCLTIVLGMLWPGYDPIRQTQSELGAVDAPHGRVMNVAGFMTLGGIILAFAAVYAAFVRPGIWQRLVVGFLAIAGVGMVIVGFFPCDAGCVHVTRTSDLHSFFSMPPAIGLPTAMMFSALAFRRDGRFGRAWQVALFGLGLVALASGPIIAAGLLPGLLGLIQRVTMWTAVLWITAVSLRLHRIGGATVPPGRVGIPPPDGSPPP